MEKKYLLLFIHGLTGDSTTFGNFPKLIEEGPLLHENFEIDLWSYPTFAFSIPFLKKTSANVNDLANGLRTYLTHRTEPHIVLVCHSLGGLVVRRMLLDDLLKGHKNNIKHTFFFATPHEGSGLAALARLISPWQPQLRALCRDSELLNRLNEDWHSQDMEAKYDLTYVVGGLDNIVSAKNGKGFYANRRAETISDADHVNIVKPVDRKDLRYKVVEKVLLQIVAEIPVPENSMAVEAVPEISMTVEKAFDYLKSTDPLNAKMAIKYFSNRPEYMDEIINSSGSNIVTDDARRKIVATYPQESSSIILRLIKECETSGHRWHAASSAANVCTAQLRPYLEPDLVDLLSNSHIEQQRHVLSALGRIGSASTFYPEIIEQVNSDDEKLLFYGLEAAMASLVIARDDFDTNNCLKIIRTFINDYGSRAMRDFDLLIYRHKGLAPRHTDLIINSFFNPNENLINKAGLSLLDQIDESRSSRSILNMILASNDRETQMYGAAIIWKKKNLEIIADMRRRLLSEISLEGVGFGLDSIENPDDFNMLLPTALKVRRLDYLALRAIGLQKKSEHIPKLLENLDSTESINRGCAALALARLGWSGNELKRTHIDAHDESDRIFAALALIHGGLEPYEKLHDQLRDDLTKNSYRLVRELQIDILSVLTSCGSPAAHELAAAWSPYYYPR